MTALFVRDHLQCQSIKVFKCISSWDEWIIFWFWNRPALPIFPASTASTAGWIPRWTLPWDNQPCKWKCFYKCKCKCKYKCKSHPWKGLIFLWTSLEFKNIGNKKGSIPPNIKLGVKQMAHHLWAQKCVCYIIWEAYFCKMFHVCKCFLYLNNVCKCFLYLNNEFLE